MLAHIRAALAMMLLFVLLTGLAYPALVTLAAKGIAPGAAAGSLLRDAQGRVVGSALIAQPFAKPEYLHPRPSAAGDNGYDATSSGGSNYGPLEPKLADRVKETVAAWKADGVAAKLPGDAVTASGSGLDPHVSPETARLQVPRIAAARGASPADVQAILDAETEGRTIAILGEPRVNVLKANIALDSRFPMPAR